jgi:hypothetical protein
VSEHAALPRHASRTTWVAITLAATTTATALVALRTSPAMVPTGTAPVAGGGAPTSWTSIVHRPPIYDLSVLKRTG